MTEKSNVVSFPDEKRAADGMCGVDFMRKLSDENLLDESHTVKVFWTSTDTDVDGPVEELACIASQFMPTQIAEDPSVAAYSH